MNIKPLIILTAGTLMSVPALANGKPQPSELADPVALMLLIIAGFLLIAIAVLGNAVMGAMDIFREKMKKDAGKAMITIGVILLAMSGALKAHAADALVEAPTSGLLSKTSLWTLVSVILLEILVIITLLFTLKHLVGIQRKRKPKKAPVPGKPRVNWFEKLNNTKTVDQASEAEQDMGHDYDGIRELNNPTPPWWKWGFYFSIAFGVVYLWRGYVSGTAPTQIEELAMAEEKAAAAKAEFLKNAANNVDENTVTLLTSADELAGGQKLFVSNCAPCHGPQGQGVVGPNLTDEYWLHGGKINDVFKTIKYGVPEKGMKAWQEDFSPRQIAMLASFIESIKGSNPPNPKAPQGEKAQ
ncbi:cytochrome c oxidase cbb3-type subunit 3 [Chitinophaga jiangningensis]|uniref:Cytochrome c oxidase cbb3-type subunit 3 n=1 Tax=Chitinophaga jiangningensis TaxID=1419482 RepID=A0A1M7EEY5_9BACT|nr:cbb3-type cytochrome c oxidase N-terminal domain-containing protein [Chitinophaga jiangningensis]SHL90345.1 cytochrome c oxidase cbb3-type subunit 3 [Chitinophaga jiangningensis]